MHHSLSFAFAGVMFSHIRREMSTQSISAAVSGIERMPNSGAVNQSNSAAFVGTYKESNERRTTTNDDE